MSVLLYVIWARVVNVIEILLVVYALLSWFPGAYDTSLGRIIRQIVQPILAPLLIPYRWSRQYAPLESESGDFRLVSKANAYVRVEGDGHCP